MSNTHVFGMIKLKGEYRETYNKISKYIKACIIDDVNYDDIMNEVVDSLLAAQEEERNITEVVGNDLRKYCDSLVKSVGPRTKVLGIIETFIPAVYFSLFLYACEWFDLIGEYMNGKHIDLLEVKTGVDCIGYLIGISFFAVAMLAKNRYIRNHIFDNQNIEKRARAIGGCITSVWFGILIFLNHKFDKYPLKGFAIYEHANKLVLHTVVIVGFLIGYRLFTIRERRIRKENKAVIGDLLDSNLSVQLYSEVDKMERKRFEKANIKNKKRGLEDKTFAEFLKDEEKSCNSFDKKPIFYISLAVIATILATIFTNIFGGFEGVSDLFIYIGVMLIVETIVLFPLYKLQKSGVRNRLIWINNQKEKSMD